MSQREEVISNDLGVLGMSSNNNRGGVGEKSMILAQSRMAFSFVSSPVKENGDQFEREEETSEMVEVTETEKEVQGANEG
jgi:hypothetical protein